MPTIDTVLKAEIARLARKQLRAELDPMKKVLAQQRVYIAAMKRELELLRKQLKALQKRSAGSTLPARGEDPEAPLPQRRFSAQRLAAHRAHLGLSALDYGRLVGVSALSIYKWESGKVRPRARQLESLAVVRALGKREAGERLAALDTKAQKKTRGR